MKIRRCSKRVIVRSLARSRRQRSVAGSASLLLSRTSMMRSLSTVVVSHLIISPSFFALTPIAVGIKVSYTVTCVTQSNLKGKGSKLLKTPKDTKSEVLQLQADEPFDTFQAQLLSLFSRNYKSVKNKDSWQWYDVCWSVTRAHLTPTELRTDDHFDVMLGKAVLKGEVKIKMTERSKEYVSYD